MQDSFVCPLDRGTLTNQKCVACGTTFPLVATESQRSVIDYRALDHVTPRELPIRIPVRRPDEIDLEAFGVAARSNFKAPSRGRLRRLYGTKLQREILYYLHEARETYGPDARVLDLGCGNGGNKRYLLAHGFTHVTAVDYFPTTGAEALVDAHRLPLPDGSIDVVLSTATIEHFAQPFVAFAEIARVLRPGGRFIGSVSFWESWHGRSCFHMTPDGIAILCASANLTLVDLWPGWGFIPAILRHGLGLPGLRRVTYAIQRAFDGAYALARGASAARSHQFRTAGSFGLVAQAGEHRRGDTPLT